MQLAVEPDSAIILPVADVLCRREIPGNSLQIHVAHVAELADALDSGKISWPFHAEFRGFTPSVEPL
jgi:hypothetical protein